MSGFILHKEATIRCAHGGQAQPTTMSERVMVSNQPIVLQPNPHAVSACPFTTPGGNPLPCVTAIWITGATRVTSNEVPVLLFDSQAKCFPNGTPVVISSAQTKVIAT